MKPREVIGPYIIILLFYCVQSKVEEKKRQLDPYTQEKLEQEIKTKIQPLLEQRLTEIVNKPGNQDISKSQIKYLLDQSIKKIQPEKFYVDKNEKSKNPSYVGYLSTQDAYVTPLERENEPFSLPVNFNTPTTKRSEDMVPASQTYQDQLYHQQQFNQQPKQNSYPQPQLIQNYPNQAGVNYQQIPPQFQQVNQQQLPQNIQLQPQALPIQNYSPQIAQQQYQPIQNQNIQPIPSLPQIAPTTVPLAIPILERFLQRPQQQILPEQQNIQPPQQPVPLPPQQFYILPQQQQVQPIQGNQVAYYVPQQQQQQQQPLQSPPSQTNQVNGINLRADIQENLFPQNEEQRYQQPVFSFNEPPPPADQQIENPPQQQNNYQKYPLGPGIQGPINNETPIGVQNLPLINTQPVLNYNGNGQQITQGVSQQGVPYTINQGYPVQAIPNQGYPTQAIPNQGYQAQSIPNQGYAVQSIPNQGQFGPQGPLPNYQDERQQYDGPNQQYIQNAPQNQQGLPPSQGYRTADDPNGQGPNENTNSTEPPFKYNIEDEAPPINNFVDLLRPPSIDYRTQQQKALEYQNSNPNPPLNPNNLVYTTPNPQNFDSRISGIRPPNRDQDPYMRGDPGYKPTGSPAPWISGIRDLTITPLNGNQISEDSDSTKKTKHDLPNDLFTLPVHFATPNKTMEYQQRKQEERKKLNAQNIQSLYDLQANSQMANGPTSGYTQDRNSNYLPRTGAASNQKVLSKVNPPKMGKQRQKRNFFYLPPAENPYSYPDENPYPSETPYSTPEYYNTLNIRYVPIYIPKPTGYFFILRFCPITIDKTSNGKTIPPMAPTTPTVITSTSTTTTTVMTEEFDEAVTESTVPDDNTISSTTDNSSTNDTTTPTKCDWAIVSCCSTTMMQQRSQCFELLGCKLDQNDPCSTESLAKAVQATSDFYKNTTNVLLENDRRGKKGDTDDYDDTSGNDLLFYDDFEVPENITLSPDSLETSTAARDLSTTLSANRIVRLANSNQLNKVPTSTTKKVVKPIKTATTTKKLPRAVSTTKAPARKPVVQNKATSKPNVDNKNVKKS